MTINTGIVVPAGNKMRAIEMVMDGAVDTVARFATAAGDDDVPFQTKRAGRNVRPLPHSLRTTR